MSESSLLRAIELFYQQGFSFEQARVICEPALGTKLCEAELETFQEEGTEEPFLSGVDLALSQPATVHFGRLTQRFGPARKGAIPPDCFGCPTPYHFLVEDRYELDGLFIVHVQAQASESENATVRLTLKRFTTKGTQAGREVRRVMKQLGKKPGS